MLIPKGTYPLADTSLKGPCKSSVEVQVEGTLQAPPHTQPSGDKGWVMFEYLDKFTLSGTGVFDGLGKAGWEKNDCHLKKICTKLPMVISIRILITSCFVLFF